MESVNFFINSKNREAGSINDSDFYYNFNYRSNETADNVLNIDMLSIPRSYYSINDYNNVFQIDPNVFLGTITSAISDVTLTKGDYTTTTLINECVNKVNALGITDLGVSMTYSSTSKKFSFLDVTGVNFITTEKQKYLGLSSGTHTPTGSTLVSDSVVDLTGTNSINVVSDIDVQTFNNTDKNS